ncbi:actin-associated protein FAM107A isoform X2 [Sparus aurata]|uniref:actin-associated protein FAM107A isoform X2 n=1 Tax=Sparus aurata TaxID=8175 RepID=UPI0011C18243|nr:actin-associated protein FAM107A-like isoform X2 [Sparus aurata]
MSLNGSFPNINSITHMEIQTASRSRMLNNTQCNNHRRDNGVKAEPSSGQSHPMKASRTHNELHKELLLAHKRGLALSSRSELQQVLERRKRVQNDREDEGQSRTPLEDVLLRRQQKQLEREKEQEEKVREEAQLMEFVRVRQNLRKIHSAIQNKAAHSLSAPEEFTQHVE